MLTVAYLANQFPSPVEPYVMDEIEELRRRGIRVIAGSVRRPDGQTGMSAGADRGSDSVVHGVVLQPVQIALALRAAWLCLWHWRRIADLIWRVIVQGQETPMQRAKALLHTWLGACYALRLQDLEVEHIQVEHIHVHHGYFGSWIAMVAARLLRVSYSMTLHGSDLLTRASYLDAKLKNCRFCVTISEYNRRYILEHYSTVALRDVVVARLGVDVPELARTPPAGICARDDSPDDSKFHLLAVGRLHAVKDHAFLLRACAQLCQRGLDFHCEIAGEGPERDNLERLIREYGLETKVALLGHVPHEQQDRLYQRVHMVVLTSRSEGIPLVLMEAMARGKIVLAPAITGIPELVVAGQTGFLYEPGSVEDFVTWILWLRAITSARGFAGDSPGVSVASQVHWLRQRAQEQVRRHFYRKKNLEAFGDLFLKRVFPEQTFPTQVDPQQIESHENSPHEDPLLQQI